MSSDPTAISKGITHLQGPLVTGTVVAVSLSGSQAFSKQNQLTIRLLVGLG
jgi:hypothetical protein